MFFPLQFKRVTFPSCSIAQAVNRLVLCFCCHMKRVEITIVATVWLQKWKTKVLPFSWKHQLQDRWFFFLQVFSSSCSKKLFSIPFVCLLLGFKAGFTFGWLKSGKLFCTDHGKTNCSKEGERIKILFIRGESWPQCPELLHCLNGLTCWHQGELCVDWSCSDIAGFAVLSSLCFGAAAQEHLCSPERKEGTEVNYFWPVIKQHFQWERAAKRTGCIAESSWLPLAFHTVSCIWLCWKTTCAFLPWCCGTAASHARGCPTSLSLSCIRSRLVCRSMDSVKGTVSAAWRSVDWAGTSWGRTWQKT